MSSLASSAATGLGFSASLANATGLTQRLLGKNTRLQFVGKRGVILQLDATTAEEHGREATVTAFPIEGGGTINDHIILAPINLTVTGTISDTPLADLKALLTESAGVAASAALGPLGIVAGSTAFGLYKALKGAKSPSVLAFAQLCKMQAGDLTAKVPTPPEPFDVVTGLQRYPSMVIQSLSVPRSVSTSRSLVFTVKMVQLQVVSPQTIPIAVFSNPRLAAAKQQTGDQELEAINGASDGLAVEKATAFSKTTRAF